MTPADGLQGDVGGEMQVEPPIIIMSMMSQADTEVPITLLVPTWVGTL